MDIVMRVTIARQRLGKNIPEVKLSTIEGHPLLGKKNKHAFLTTEEVFSI
jgi:hypothetical protein